MSEQGYVGIEGGGKRHFAYGLADGGQVVALAYEGEGHVEVAVRAVVALDALGSQGVLKTKESGLNLVAELYGYEYSGHITSKITLCIMYSLIGYLLIVF